MTSSRIKLKRVRPLLGTYVEITLCGCVPAETLHAWITTGFEAIEEIDRLMSLHRPRTDLTRLNKAKPWMWVGMHPHTLRVLKTSNDLYALSKGAFDIRCATAPAGTPPLEIKDTGVRKTGPWTFDLGGIAKGYAVDCAVDKIKQLSRGRLAYGVVNAGGDLRRWGKEAVPVAVATSAVRTPTNSECLSAAVHVQMPEGRPFTKQKAVTVFADRCLWSDGLTKIMLLAPPRITDLCFKRYHAHGLVLA